MGKYTYRRVDRVIAIGATVRLKSGGPVMTAGHMEDKGGKDGKDGIFFDCHWFNETEGNYTHFKEKSHVNSLDIVEKQT